MPRGPVKQPSRLHTLSALSLWLLLGAVSRLTAAETVILHGGGSSYDTTAPYQPDAAEMLETFSAEALRNLAAPIALYPDDLLALILPAATHPLQIVEAARYLADLDANPDQAPDEAWDPAVVALLNYPEVVQLLDADLSWTRDLGQATLNQEAELIAAVEAFRQEAYAAGNLNSDHRLVVEENDGALEIRPAHPQVLYVPYYDPHQVLLRQTTEVYHYYPRPYPVYYYPYATDYWFASSWFWGVRNSYRIGWRDRHVYLNRPYADRRYHSGYGNHRYRGDHRRFYRARGVYPQTRFRRHMDRPYRGHSYTAGSPPPRQQRNGEARQAAPSRHETRQPGAKPQRPIAQRPRPQGPRTEGPRLQRPPAPRPGIPPAGQNRQRASASALRGPTTSSRSTTSQAASMRSPANTRSAESSAESSAETSAARPGLSSGGAPRHQTRPGLADPRFGGNAGSRARR